MTPEQLPYDTHHNATDALSACQHQAMKALSAHTAERAFGLLIRATRYAIQAARLNGDNCASALLARHMAIIRDTGHCYPHILTNPAELRSCCRCTTTIKAFDAIVYASAIMADCWEATA